LRRHIFFPKEEVLKLNSFKTTEENVNRNLFSTGGGEGEILKLNSVLEALSV
jgi:hypothetical protein